MITRTYTKPIVKMQMFSKKLIYKYSSVLIVSWF